MSNFQSCVKKNSHIGSKKDILPLIDNCQFKQQDERSENIIKVVVTVMVPIEGGAL